jgi:hypothetical protein
LTEPTSVRIAPSFNAGAFRRPISLYAENRRRRGGDDDEIGTRSSCGRIVVGEFVGLRCCL